MTNTIQPDVYQIPAQKTTEHFVGASEDSQTFVSANPESAHKPLVLSEVPVPLDDLHNAARSYAQTGLRHRSFSGEPEENPDHARYISRLTAADTPETRPSPTAEAAPEELVPADALYFSRLTHMGRVITDNFRAGAEAGTIDVRK